MADLSLPWGGDLSVTNDGDLVTVDELDLTDEHVIRRLLTNPNDYLWHPTYGAGIPRFIGQAVPPSSVVRVAKAQILQEASVARTPPPIIKASFGFDLISMDIQYTAASSGAPQRLSFDVTP